MIVKIINNIGQTIDDDDIFEFESTKGIEMFSTSNKQNALGKKGGYFVMAQVDERIDIEVIKKCKKYLAKNNNKDNEYAVILAWYKTKKRSFEVLDNIINDIKFTILRNYFNECAYYKMPEE